jgi:predicted RNA binding protein YcfA (HicA-like mRNA interferase family)
MKSVTGKQMAEVLEHNGWHLMRIKGSHHVYGREGVPARISIPIHGNKELKIGLVRHFLKTANLNESDL